MVRAGFSRFSAGLIYQDKLISVRERGLRAMDHDKKAVAASMDDRPVWVALHRRFAKRWARLAMESYSNAIGFASI